MEAALSLRLSTGPGKEQVHYDVGGRPRVRKGDDTDTVSW